MNHPYTPVDWDGWDGFTFHQQRWSRLEPLFLDDPLGQEENEQLKKRKGWDEMDRLERESTPKNGIQMAYTLW